MQCHFIDFVRGCIERKDNGCLDCSAYKNGRMIMPKILHGPDADHSGFIPWPSNVHGRLLPVHTCFQTNYVRELNVAICCSFEC